jgi:hypothetical protein
MEQLIGVLKRKQDKINEIWELVRSIAFGDTEEDIEAYIKLIDQREILVNETKIIEAELKELLGQTPDPALDTEARRMIRETDETIRKIAALEEQNQPCVAQMMESVKKNIKEIKNGKAMSQYYQNIDTNSEGQYYDRKK